MSGRNRRRVGATTETHQNVTITNAGCGRQTLEKYAGHKTIIKADLWCNLFEVQTRGQNDKDRIYNLMAYLIDDALNWYASDIAPTMAAMTWTQVRSALIARFGQAITNPLVDAQYRTLKSTETVKTYYEDKMRYLKEIRLRDEDIVAMLTEGMPTRYRGYLISAAPPNAVAWLTLSLQLEASSLSQLQNQTTVFRQTLQRPVVLNTGQQYAANQTSYRPPLQPCRFCADAGITAYHWHRECSRRRERPFNSNGPAVTNHSK